MGNNDGIIEALVNYGKNRTEEFDGGHFSFALGDEIALVINYHYFILNCDEELWEEVKNKIIETDKDKLKLITWWIEMSKKYEISDWSDSFEELIQKIKEIK